MDHMDFIAYESGRISKMNRIKNSLLFMGIVLFFIWTAPANHSEAEDAYYYAHMAEQGAWTEMFHAHHLLYLPLMRIVFLAVQLVGYTGRAFPVLTGISMVSGALAVCLSVSLLRRAGVKERLVWFFSAALLFSYGFWRYSTTGEIYTPATALSLLTLYCADRGTGRKFFWCGVLSGGFALLLHLVTIPAVLCAVPLLYVFRRQKLRAGLHMVLTLLLALAGYGGIAAAGVRPVVFADTLVRRGTLLEPLTWLKGLVAWGQTVLSGNFLFSIPDTAERLVRLLPFNMLQEELFMGQQAQPWIPFVAPVTFGLAVGLAAGIFCIVMRHIKRVMANQSAVPVSFFVWFAGAAAMALCFEPTNPEMWICALPPFWILTGLVWNAVPEGRLSRWMPVALVAVLLLHNWAGGMSLVKRPQADYCRQKGFWIIEQARPGDLILSADSHSFITFLACQTPACVLDAKFASADEFTDAAEKFSGRVFVFEEVLRPLPPVSRRLPASVQSMQQLGAVLMPGLQMIHWDSFGTVYQWTQPRHFPSPASGMSVSE